LLTFELYPFSTLAIFKLLSLFDPTKFALRSPELGTEFRYTFLSHECSPGTALKKPETTVEQYIHVPFYKKVPIDLVGDSLGDFLRRKRIICGLAEIDKETILQMGRFAGFHRLDFDLPNLPDLKGARDWLPGPLVTLRAHWQRDRVAVA